MREKLPAAIRQSQRQLVKDFAWPEKSKYSRSHMRPGDHPNQSPKAGLPFICLLESPGAGISTPATRRP